MGDISDLLPKKTATVLAIFDMHKKKGDAEPQRGYLGASIVGDECDYRLWATFRGAISEDMPGRIFRLLETGDFVETRLIRELREIGCTVHDRDEKGEQFAVSAHGGHFSGHLDAVVEGIPEAPKTPHLLETKTANDKYFAEIEKKGVKEAKPQHYAQMQTYMGLMGLKRALYLVVNKNTDDLYGERVEFDREAFEKLMARAKRLIESPQAPPRLAGARADFYKCKFCPGHSLCWPAPDATAAVPIKGGVTCRTCCHATADTEKGGWRCERFGTAIEDTAVGAKCPAHLLLPGFVTFAEPSDSDDGWIEFTNKKDGAKWRLASAELAAGAPPHDQAWTSLGLMETRGPLDAPQKREHVAHRCDWAWVGDTYGPLATPPEPCGRPYCERCKGTLFSCEICGAAEAELAVSCPGVLQDPDTWPKGRE